MQEINPERQDYSNENEIQDIVDSVQKETLNLDNLDIKSHTIEEELQKNLIAIIGEDVDTGKNQVVVVTPQIYSSDPKSLQEVEKVLKAEGLESVKNGVSLGIINDQQEREILSNPTSIRITSTNTNTEQKESNYHKKKLNRGILLTIVAGMALAGCKALPTKRNNQILDLPQTIPQTNTMPDLQSEPVPIIRSAITNEIVMSEGMDFDITDKTEIVDTERVKSTLWGESKFPPLLTVKDVENPYELIPDFYYSDILPYIIDDIQEICRNDTQKARSMTLALPAVSHLGQVITISDEEKYNENIEIVKLGRYLLDENLDPGKYMTDGASEMNISIGKSVADNLPEIIDSIYNEYEQEKNPNSDFNFVLKIADGYRNFARQQQARITVGKASAARAGESQHHTGLAFDAYYTSTQEDICSKFNRHGVVCPFMDEEKSGMVDPPHFFYLDGYMPGLTETIMNYFIRNGIDPMNVNDINIINKVLLGVSQTIESELSTETNPF